jgi:hypothetical protein
MVDYCEECGAVLPEEWTCQNAFDECLVREFC